jgi:hypothetical protein
LKSSLAALSQRFFKGFKPISYLFFWKFLKLRSSIQSDSFSGHSKVNSLRMNWFTI